eukprot:m.348635 g.348635  ORF g.348635 m.348635 type:complete len:553 (+) comp16563_c2_seq1:1365-3023(+)
MWGANGLDRMGRVYYHKRVRETKPSKEDGREQRGNGLERLGWVLPQGENDAGGVVRVPWLPAARRGHHHHLERGPVARPPPCRKVRAVGPVPTEGPGLLHVHQRPRALWRGGLVQRELRGRRPVMPGVVPVPRDRFPRVPVHKAVVWEEVAAEAGDVKGVVLAEHKGVLKDGRRGRGVGVPALPRPERVSTAGEEVGGGDSAEEEKLVGVPVRGGRDGGRGEVEVDVAVGGLLVASPGLDEDRVGEATLEHGGAGGGQVPAGPAVCRGDDPGVPRPLPAGNAGVGAVEVANALHPGVDRVVDREHRRRLDVAFSCVVSKVLAADVDDCLGGDWGVVDQAEREGVGTGAPPVHKSHGLAGLGVVAPHSVGRPVGEPGRRPSVPLHPARHRAVGEDTTAGDEGASIAWGGWERDLWPFEHCGGHFPPMRAGDPRWDRRLEQTAGGIRDTAKREGIGDGGVLGVKSESEALGVGAAKRGAVPERCVDPRDQRHPGVARTVPCEVRRVHSGAAATASSVHTAAVAASVRSADNAATAQRQHRERAPQTGPARHAHA